MIPINGPSIVLGVVLLVLLAGCESEDADGADEGAVDVGQSDGLVRPDDAGALDEGADTATVDATPLDQEIDAAQIDAAQLDLAVADASPPDVLEPDAAPVDPNACNGHVHLCDRPFDQVAFAMTHNAHAHAGEFDRLAANQHLDIEAQLALGVRGLGIKLYATESPSCGEQGIYGYHGFPTLGCVTFASIAAPIRGFLDTHPRDVLAVTVEGGASAEEVRAAFAAEGLSGWLHQQDRAEPWPTLGMLIESDRRLVVFSADARAEGVSGLQHLWTRVQDTPYSAARFEDFRCERDRGPEDARLLLFNHFVTVITPRADLAEQINQAEVIGPRIAECAASRGLPNFVYVDFLGSGDVLDVVDIVNGPGVVEDRLEALRQLR